MNPYIKRLQPYPFERLNALKAGVQAANKAHISLSIGEPKHSAPQQVLDTLANNLDKVSIYPKTAGSDHLRLAIKNWLSQRFQLETDSLSNANILPLNGTREGLFSFIQAAVDGNQANAKVFMPNPFYQIYEGATLLAGAEPYFLNCSKAQNYLYDAEALLANDEQALNDCQLLIICTPGNPTGATLSKQQLIELIKLAEKYDFIIASDECYSEIYFNEEQPPTGLLEACRAMGNNNYARCVVFHSLSKRSNLPGLRSGFIAGDSDIISSFLQYRTYHGCAMAEPVQIASSMAWGDEQHVIANRQQYQKKFTEVLDCLDGSLNVAMPDAAFYLWPELPEDDESFCQKLFAQQHITALPGQYLSRKANGINPGSKHMRLALVATQAECLDAAKRIKQFMHDNYS